MRDIFFTVSPLNPPPPSSYFLLDPSWPATPFRNKWGLVPPRQCWTESRVFRHHLVALRGGIGHSIYLLKAGDISECDFGDGVGVCLHVPPRAVTLEKRIITKVTFLCWSSPSSSWSSQFWGWKRVWVSRQSKCKCLFWHQPDLNCTSNIQH